MRRSLGYGQDSGVGVSRTIREQCAAKCFYFRGIQNVCDAGIDPKTVRDSSQPGPYRWPCLTVYPEKKATTTCAKFRPYTLEEIDAEEAEIDAAIAEMLRRSAANQCIHCGEPIASRQTVGQCEYAAPCGHRQGQVAEPVTPFP